MISAVLKKINGEPLVIELDGSNREQWASFSVFYCNDQNLALNTEIKPKFDIGISSIKVYGDCILFNSDIACNPINLDVASRYLLDAMFNMHI